MNIEVKSFETAAAPVSITAVPVAGRIGAEIRGVRLSADLSDEVVSGLAAALTRYKVLFFRGQHHLDDGEQEAVGRRFGAPFAHPTLPNYGAGNIYELDSREPTRGDHWHTDLTFLRAYPSASILRSVKLPSVGGDTMWANTASAYADMPEALRAFADQLWAIHATRPYNPHAPEAVRRTFARDAFEAEHPVVRVHPVTGERNLVLGGRVREFVGHSLETSRRLYDVFQDFVTRPDNTVRWRWSLGDVAIWDNRATQHYALSDYGDETRIMRRITLQGDIPRSVDGRQSRQLVGGLAE